MIRRRFIASVAASLMAGVAAVAAEEKPLRKVYRILVDGKRERVRMYQLRVGDVVEIEANEGQWKTVGIPYINDEGIWMVEATSYAPTK